MSDRNIVHATFTLERTYPAPIPRVFNAWADPEVKSQWFGGNPNGFEMDFRPDGIERNHVALDGKKITWESLYREIVPEQRIVYTSVLSEDGTVATVSLTTVEFATDGAGTSLVLTETGAYLDGRELPEWREEGTASWLDSLGRHLQPTAS
jgi:uncharacterized protein YndB with AHSA1/START domain